MSSRLTGERRSDVGLRINSRCVIAYVTEKNRSRKNRCHKSRLIRLRDCRCAAADRLSGKRPLAKRLHPLIHDLHAPRRVECRPRSRFVEKRYAFRFEYHRKEAVLANGQKECVPSGAAVVFPGEFEITAECLRQIIRVESRLGEHSCIVDGHVRIQIPRERVNRIIENARLQCSREVFYAGMPDYFRPDRKQRIDHNRLCKKIG